MKSCPLLLPKSALTWHAIDIKCHNAVPSHCYYKFIPTRPKMIRRMPQIRWLLNSESSSVADTFVLMLPVHSVVYNHFLYPSYPVLQRAGCNCNNRMHDWPQWQLLRSTFNNPTAADHPNSLPLPSSSLTSHFSLDMVNSEAFIPSYYCCWMCFLI